MDNVGPTPYTRELKLATQKRLCAVMWIINEIPPQTEDGYIWGYHLRKTLKAKGWGVDMARHHNLMIHLQVRNFLSERTINESLGDGRFIVNQKQYRLTDEGRAAVEQLREDDYTLKREPLHWKLARVALDILFFPLVVLFGAVYIPYSLTKKAIGR